MGFIIFANGIYCCSILYVADYRGNLKSFEHCYWEEDTDIINTHFHHVKVST